MALDDKDFLEDNFSFEDLKVTKKHKELSKFDNFIITLEEVFDTLKIKVKALYIKVKNKFLQFDYVTRILVSCGVLFIIIFSGISFKFINTKIKEKEVVAVSAIDNNVVQVENKFLTSSIFDEGSINKVLFDNLGQFENIRLKYNNNEDIVAYLSIFGTNINTPVAQTIDNTFYQDHDLHKNKNVNGAVYLDTTSEIIVFGKNTVVFGRTDIANEQLFDLALYEDENFYKQNRFINFDTVYNSSVWQIYSFYKNSEDNFYLKTDFTDEEFETFVVGTKNLSMYDNDVVVDKDDSILTITSTNSSGDKYVIHAKLYKK